MPKEKRERAVSADIPGRPSSKVLGGERGGKKGHCKADKAPETGSPSRQVTEACASLARIASVEGACEAADKRTEGRQNKKER